MWRSKTRWRYFAIGVIVLVGLWLWLGRISLFQTATYTSRLGLGFGDLYQDDVLWLKDDSQIQQTFVARFPGLYKVTVLLTNPQPLENEIGLTFRLKQTCTSPARLREVTVDISPEDVSHDVFYAFTFTPVDDVVQQELCFTLTRKTDSRHTNAIGIRVSHSDVYAEGQGFYTPPHESIDPEKTRSNHQPTSLPYKIFLPLIHHSPRNADFDVGFQLYYDGPPFQTMRAFVAQLVDHKPFIFGNPGFYLVLVIAYCTGLVFLLKVTKQE